MTYYREFYKNLPYHARLLDEKGILEAISNAIQRQLDRVEQRRRFLELIYNPETTPEEWIPWLQQLIGGSSSPNYWLGTGIHPNWTLQRKRRFLLEAWDLWNRKGTEGAIRQSIDLWLDWPAAYDRNRLVMTQPFGNKADTTPGLWWGYDTRYDANRTKKHIERRWLGSGDYPQEYQSPGWGIRSNWKWEYGEVWDLRDSLYAVSPAKLEDSKPYLGPQNVWTHFDLADEFEWNKISPDIHDLNPEIWPARIRPNTWMWRSANATLPLPETGDSPRQVKKVSFSLDGFQYSDILPFPAHLPAQKQVETVTKLWGTDLYFQYGDFYGGVGGRAIERAGETTTIIHQISRWGGYLVRIPYFEYVESELRVETDVVVQNPDGQQSNSADFLIEGEELKVLQTRGFDYWDSLNTGWQWTASLEAQTIMLPVEREIKVLAFEGANYGDLYYSTGQTQTRSEETQRYRGAAPNYNDLYGYPWGYQSEIIATTVESTPYTVAGTPWQVMDMEQTITETGAGEVEHTPRTSANQWFTSYKEITSTVITELPARESCSFGSTGLIEVETETETDPDIPAGLPTLSLEPVSGEASETVTPGRVGSVGLDWMTVFNSASVAIAPIEGLSVSYEDLTAIDTTEIVAIPTEETITLTSGSEAPYIDAKDTESWWQYPATEEVVTTTPGTTGFRSVMPFINTFYGSIWNNGSIFYHNGSAAIPGETREIPILRTAYLCNIAGFYSRRQAVDYTEEWIDMSAEVDISKIFPLLTTAVDPEQWHAIIETDEELLKIKPTTMFGVTPTGTRTMAISLKAGEETDLYMEFIYRLYRNTQIRSMSIFLETVGLVHWEGNLEILDAHKLSAFGFAVTVKLTPEFAVVS